MKPERLASFKEVNKKLNSNLVKRGTSSRKLDHNETINYKSRNKKDPSPIKEENTEMCLENSPERRLSFATDSSF